MQVTVSHEECRRQIDQATKAFFAAVERITELQATIDRYRYAVHFASAVAWDGGPDIRSRFAWARCNDPGGMLTDDRTAEIGKAYLVQTAIKG
jgi:hypothetical protein